MTKIKRSIICAMCIALCVVLPQAFHAIPNAGSIWLPMHIPVLLCGLICGPMLGMLCGIFGPILSSVITGMPVIAYLPQMVIECALYGLVSGFMMRVIKTKSLYLDLYFSLIIAMLIGRIVAGILKALIFMAGKYSLAIWISSYFVTALPGIIVQIIVVPSIVVALIKAKLIKRNYE